MTDVMIDLETLGTGSDTPVVSIGAACFNTKTKNVGATYYAILNLDEQFRRGRQPTQSTVKWWIGQGEKAQKVFAEPGRSVEEVLLEFAKFYKDHTDPKTSFVWGNGSSFDISIMEHLYNSYGIPIPWFYNKVLDLRTFKKFVANNAPIVNNGISHNALDDAIAQAQYVMRYL